MDPLLLVVKYIFKKKNSINNDESIKCFFSNGISFPQFIALIYNEEIPDFRQNPTSSRQKIANNNAALEFLCQKNKMINLVHPTFDTAQNQTKLLMLIFTRECFKFDEKKMILEISKICHTPFHEKPFLSGITLLLILKVFTDCKINPILSLDENENFNTIQNYFKQENIPLVINQNTISQESTKSLQLTNEDHSKLTILLIQIQIIFDTFPDKYKELFDKGKDEEKPPQKSNFFGGWNLTKKDPSKELSFSQSFFDKLTKVEPDENKEIEANEIKMENIIIRILNIIGQGKFRFNNLIETISNDSLPKFVMFHLNIESIENVNLSETIKSTKDGHITKQEIKNIYAVIKYLSQKEVKFEILKFNFSNPNNQKDSAFLFYQNFLDLFFLKKTKKEMFERAQILLTNSVITLLEDDITRTSFCIILLHFITNKTLNRDFFSVPSCKELAKQYFERANIPMIIEDETQNQRIKNFYNSVYYYQIQFIYDAIDSGSPTLRIIEIFLQKIHKAKQIKKLNYDSIIDNIKAKNISLQFQKSRLNHYYQRKSSKSIESPNNYDDKIDNDEDENEKHLPMKFKDRLNKAKNYVDKKGSLIDSLQNDFWNPPDLNLNLEFSNGIIHDKSQNNDQSQIKWNNEIQNIQKSLKKSDRKSLNLDSNNKISSEKNANEQTLYKIFYYNETSNNWCFDSDSFNKFSIDNDIKDKQTKIPLVLFLDSNEEEMTTLAFNMINCINPKIEDQILVYAFSNKNLYSNENSVKPIFLFLHIPDAKAKLPNILIIIFQVYIFLSLISDLEIVILNKNFHLDQIEFIKVIDDINNSIIFQKFDLNSEDDIDITNIEKVDSNNQENLKVNDDELDDVINNEYEEDEEDSFDSNKNVVEKLIKTNLKDSKRIFLINDETVKFTDKIQRKIQKSQYFKSLTAQSIKENQFHYINVKDKEKYKAFLDNLNDIITNSKNLFSFSEIKSNFEFINLFEINNFYIHLRYQPSVWKKELNKLISKRYSEIKTAMHFKGNWCISLSKLKNEIELISPKFDLAFIDECNNILLKHYQKLYISELSKSSKSRLYDLEKQIKDSYLLTNVQMSNIINTHINFLKEEFFEIIELTSIEKFYHLIYENNISILDDEIKSSKEKINEFFDHYNEKINKLTKTKNEGDLCNTVNYAMKETENMKEIKITVEAGQDLQSVIPQDF